jgi:hypothetical protein
MNSFQSSDDGKLSGFISREAVCSMDSEDTVVCLKDMSGVQDAPITTQRYRPLCLRLRCMLVEGQAKMKCSLTLQTCYSLNEDRIIFFDSAMPLES